MKETLVKILADYKGVDASEIKTQLGEGYVGLNFGSIHSLVISKNLYQSLFHVSISL